MAASIKNGSVKQVKGAHLIEQSLSDELVVFDKKTNKAHMLDARAAAIYRATENGCSIDEVAEVVEGKTAAQRRAAAQLGIQDLETAGLVMSTLPRMPRRGLLKTLGVAAALPMVISILAPSPAAAASNLALGATCGVGDSCVSGLVCCAVGTANENVCGKSDGTASTCAPGTEMTHAVITGATGAVGVPSSECCSGICSSGFCVGN